MHDSLFPHIGVSLIFLFVACGFTHAESTGSLLLGKSVSFGSKYEMKTDYRKDFKLEDNTEDDILKVYHEIEFELSYDIGDSVKLYSDIKPFYKKELYLENGNPDRETSGVKRGETWIYFSDLFISNLSFQLGRQNFNEQRKWWWDEDMDAVRIYYKSGRLLLEIGIAEELAGNSTIKDGIHPEDKDVLRIPGHAGLNWAEHQQVDLFFLYSNDHSGTGPDREIINRDQRDKSDADLIWTGARSLGRWKNRSAGQLYYWIDTAMVFGKDKSIDYDRINKNKYIVDRVDERDITAWAADAGATWETCLPRQPVITLGYAVGSGDSDPDSGIDRSFRQTGLHDNNGRFQGVNSFHYYGELLRPELSNLHILTASIGLNVLKKSSVEFLYHQYRQDHAAPYMRKARIKAKPLGNDKSIGGEWDIVTGIEEWRHVDLELAAALFSAGNAFGPLSGETASYISFGLTYNF
jgi:hypothetical protein